MKMARTKRLSNLHHHPMMWVVEAKAGATAPVVDSYVLTMLQGLDSPGWVRTTILKIFSLTHFHEVTTRLWRPCQPPTLTSTEARSCSRKGRGSVAGYYRERFFVSFSHISILFFSFPGGSACLVRSPEPKASSRVRPPVRRASQGRERMGKGNTKTKRRDKYPFQPTPTLCYNRAFSTLLSSILISMFYVTSLFCCCFTSLSLPLLNCNFNSITLYTRFSFT